MLLGLTIFLGGCFVLLQIYEMNEILFSLVDTTFHASSLCTVGLHFRHVLLGVIALTMIFILGVKVSGEYWCTTITWY
ncbi:MAG: cytochrome c oxidase subunit 3 [Cetobacterium sp.]